jgi:hypothetical protein
LSFEILLSPKRSRSFLRTHAKTAIPLPEKATYLGSEPGNIGGSVLLILRFWQNPKYDPDQVEHTEQLGLRRPQTCGPPHPAAMSHLPFSQNALYVLPRPAECRLLCRTALGIERPPLRCASHGNERVADSERKWRADVALGLPCWPPSRR